MSPEALRSAESTVTLPTYRSVLLAVDSSDHSNRGTQDGVSIAALWNARVTGCHVYAAKLHDVRFRQMEGGLPEQFREEQELERQRDVHDDLITRGLSIITDSYLDQTERACEENTLAFERRSLEGKNYAELSREANSGGYDLLVLGAQGLGAVRKHHLGTVCSRVARRSRIDTLVIKEPDRAVNAGPIVVAVDGSSKAYGGLLTALSLAKEWRVAVHVVAAFDPYYHYVAFNRIAKVLSEEAGKVFRFKEQEQLHEEIIDSGLAKIYEGHLEVARGIAAEQNMEIQTELLTGKPHHVISKYLQEFKPSLLVLGKLGIHADDELDIGGNAELLLQEVECAVLLGMREHQPAVEQVAAVTTSWTNEAEKRMERVPSFVRNMARMAILRYAQERGHTVITENIVEEATANLMPGHAEQAMAQIVEAHDAGELKRSKPESFKPMRWSDEASALLRTVDDLALRGNLSMRAEKHARGENSATVERRHIAPLLDQPSGEMVVGAAKAANTDGEHGTDIFAAIAAPTKDLSWQAAALARLARVPEGFMRDASRQRIEQHARDNGIGEIDLRTAEAGLAEARKAMEQTMAGKPAAGTGIPEEKKSACPFAGLMTPAETHTDANIAVQWSREAEQQLLAVPEGFCRDMAVKAAETIAKQSGLVEITPAFVQQVMDTFQAGSAEVVETLPWDESARERIARTPDMVRGMLAREIEGWADRNGLSRVTEEAVDAVKALWQERGMFHLDPDDPRNRS